MRQNGGSEDYTGWFLAYFYVQLYGTLIIIMDVNNGRRICPREYGMIHIVHYNSTRIDYLVLY